MARLFCAQRRAYRIRNRIEEQREYRYAVSPGWGWNLTPIPDELLALTRPRPVTINVYPEPCDCWPDACRVLTHA